jgi:sigma-E factor negative regulatory protein RseA
MTDEHRSCVSALMDGELDGRRAALLYDLVGREPELRAAWERYHLIGQAVRGERVAPEIRGVADAVRLALEGEPPVGAPRPARLGRATRYVPFAGAALAAGVAILAVLAVPALLDGPGPDGWSAAPAVPFADAQRSRRWQLERPDLADKLDRFLVNHQEAVAATGVKGMLPYATLVGYDIRR